MLNFGALKTSFLNPDEVVLLRANLHPPHERTHGAVCMSLTVLTL